MTRARNTLACELRAHAFREASRYLRSIAQIEARAPASAESLRAATLLRYCAGQISEWARIWSAHLPRRLARPPRPQFGRRGPS